MEDEKVQSPIKETVDKVKVDKHLDFKKRYEHIAVKPETFIEYQKLKDSFKSDNLFIIELLRVYKLHLIRDLAIKQDKNI